MHHGHHLSEKAIAQSLKKHKHDTQSKMVVYNALTGLRRRLPKNKLNWKIRRSHSSTVSARMFGREAMKAHRTYNKGAKNCLVGAAVILASNVHHIPGFSRLLYLLLIYAALFYRKGRRMLLLESEPLDMPDVEEEEEEEERFHKELVDISLDTFKDDNECDVKTRFTKQEMRDILHHLDLPVDIRVHCHNNQYFKFDTERLVIYMLMRWTTGRTHQDMTDTFGGCPSRWSRGYSFLIHCIDTKYYPLIGPEGLRQWCPYFPQFSEDLRNFIQRDKARINYNDGRQYNLTMEYRYGPHEFNLFGFTDCSVHETCRPGSGPANTEGPSDRRDGWYIKQRAFYDGFHKGMEACIKILTICLPNGLTAAVCGPTSGGRDDRSCFYMSEFDEYLRDLCLEFHGGDLYCTYSTEMASLLVIGTVLGQRILRQLDFNSNNGRKMRMPI